MGCLQEETFKGCLTCFRVFINIFTITAFVLSLLVVFSCEFFDYKVDDGVDLPDWGGILDPNGSVGLFHYLTENDDCADYPSNYNFDNNMGTARVGGIIGVAAGGMSLLCTLSEALLCALGLFCAVPTCFFLLLAILGQGLAFSILNTEQVCDLSDCSLGKAAAYNTAALCLYFLAFVLVCSGPTGDSLREQMRKKRETKKKEEKPQAADDEEENGETPAAAAKEEGSSTKEE